MLRRTLLTLVFITAPLGAVEPPGADDWKYDVIERNRGEPLRGLIIEQSSKSVKVHCIWRKPGKPTLVFTEVIPRNEIHRIVSLDKADRDLLQKRLHALKQERHLLSDNLRATDPRTKGAHKPADSVDFRSVAWPGDDKIKALEYRSSCFRLIANTRPEFAQLAAIHLEQIYAAYSRLLPPRCKSAEPTTILLTRSLADYQALVKARGLNLFNPAFYDPSRNQVVCGSDLQRLGDELEKVRTHHAELRGRIKERRAELARVYRNKVPAELLAPMVDAERRIVRSERNNETQFARVREKLFHRLYHEAFHAYLNTFVYPNKDGPLPIWFNEGLAQIFETAIVEVGELRVRPADPDRLSKVRQSLAQGKLPPLVDLLRTKPRQFHVATGKDEQGADRNYCAAWALSVYLTFDKRVLGTPALDDYVHSLNRGTDPLEAFRKLVGRPLAEFEKDLHDYLRHLRPDGTVDNK